MLSIHAFFSWTPSSPPSPFSWAPPSTLSPFSRAPISPPSLPPSLCRPWILNFWEHYSSPWARNSSPDPFNWVKSTQQSPLHGGSTAKECTEKNLQMVELHFQLGLIVHVVKAEWVWPWRVILSEIEIQLYCMHIVEVQRAAPTFGVLCRVSNMISRSTGCKAAIKNICQWQHFNSSLPAAERQVTPQ